MILQRRVNVPLLPLQHPTPSERCVGAATFRSLNSGDAIKDSPHAQRQKRTSPMADEQSYAQQSPHHRQKIETVEEQVENPSSIPEFPVHSSILVPVPQSALMENTLQPLPLNDHSLPLTLNASEFTSTAGLGLMIPGLESQLQLGLINVQDGGTTVEDLKNLLSEPFDITTAVTPPGTTPQSPPAVSASGKTRKHVNESFLYLAEALPGGFASDEQPKTQRGILKESCRYLRTLIQQRHIVKANIAFTSRAYLRHWTRECLGFDDSEPLPISSPLSLQGPGTSCCHSPASSSQPSTQTTDAADKPTESNSSKARLSSRSIVNAPPGSPLHPSYAFSLPDIIGQYAEIYCTAEEWKYAEVWIPSTSSFKSRIQDEDLLAPHVALADQALFRYSTVQNGMNSPTVAAAMTTFAQQPMPAYSSHQPGSLPVRVACRAYPEWISDLGQQASAFRRHQEAATAGLRVALGVPVWARDKSRNMPHVAAVIIFFDTGDRHVDCVTLERSVQFAATVAHAYEEAEEEREVAAGNSRSKSTADGASIIPNSLLTDW
jgi:hypothetical protein